MYTSRPFEFRAFFGLLCSVLLVSVPAELSAWGPGHDDVMRAILKRLSPELRATFTTEIEDAAVLRSSHYPDSFDPFLPEDVGEEAVERLVNSGIKVRYGLHSERGIVASFIELMKALEAGNPKHTAHWIASYSHSVADMAACNHDPLIHTATYGWSDWDIELPSGKASFGSLSPLLDLAWSARNEAGGSAAFDSAVDGALLKDNKQGAADALVEMMLYGQTGAAYCNSRGVSILRGATGWIDSGDEAARAELWQKIGELGAWAVARTLRDLEIAQRFLREGVAPAITPDIETAYKMGVEKIIEDRVIEDEALFAPIYRDPAKTEAGAIGIVIEPTWAMNNAMLGYASRVASVSIARNLEDRGRVVATIDVREAMRSGFPEASHIPVIVLVATSFSNYHSLRTDDLDRQLTEYKDKGGKILWVGGRTLPPKKALGAFSEKIHRLDTKATLPVSDEEFLKSTVELVDESGKVKQGWKIVNRATTPAGWQRPYCAYEFYLDTDSNSELQPLVYLHTGEQRRIVGAILQDRSAACVPIYALTPYLMEGSTRMQSPSEPTLDKTSEAILDAILERLLH